LHLDEQRDDTVYQLLQKKNHGTSFQKEIYTSFKVIAKKFRFTTKIFEKNFRSSRRYSCGDFDFLIAPEKQTQKFAVVVSKKITKSAVKRNRIRRQLYEKIRTIFLPKIAGRNIICLYRGGEILNTSKKLEDCFAAVLQQSAKDFTNFTHPSSHGKNGKKRHI